MNEDVFYTSKLAAEKLGLSDKVLRNMLNAKKIKGFKEGNRWYVLHVDLIKYIKSLTPNT